MSAGIDTVGESPDGPWPFQGTRDEVLAYLQANPPGDNTVVRYGDTQQIVFATEYIANPEI